MQTSLVILFQVGKGLRKPDLKELCEDASKYKWLRQTIESCMEFDREKRPPFRKLVADLEKNAKELPRIVKCKSDPGLNNW